jgi:hypothetical protein
VISLHTFIKVAAPQFCRRSGGKPGGTARQRGQAAVPWDISVTTSHTITVDKLRSQSRQALTQFHKNHQRLALHRLVLTFRQRLR